MYIKLTKIDHDADMSGYDAVEVFGTKLEDGSEWNKAFFANATDLVNELSDFEVGDDVNVVMEQNKKNKKWWNIVGFKAMTKADRENLEKPKGSYTGKSATGTKGGSSMSKEEWAEKDRKTNIAIARAVALKTAVENLKENATVKAIFKRADELLPYLLEDVKDEGDPLDPPA